MENNNFDYLEDELLEEEEKAYLYEKDINDRLLYKRKIFSFIEEEKDNLRYFSNNEVDYFNFILFMIILEFMFKDWFNEDKLELIKEKFTITSQIKSGRYKISRIKALTIAIKECVVDNLVSGLINYLNKLNNLNFPSLSGKHFTTIAISEDDDLNLIIWLNEKYGEIYFDFDLYFVYLWTKLINISPSSLFYFITKKKTVLNKDISNFRNLVVKKAMNDEKLKKEIINKIKIIENYLN